MEIIFAQSEDNADVSILGIQGDLDASNYKDAISVAMEAHSSGAQYLVIDMSELRFMASSGLVALHSIALVMRDELTPDAEYGWDAFHSISRDQDSGVQERVVLLNPQPRVLKILEKTGFSEQFEIYSDLETAVASF
jgi:anti-anti-sigma regulatory factor